MKLTVDAFRTAFERNGAPYWAAYTDRARKNLVASNLDTADMEESWAQFEEFTELAESGTLYVALKKNPKSPNHTVITATWGQPTRSRLSGPPARRSTAVDSMEFVRMQREMEREHAAARERDRDTISELRMQLLRQEMKADRLSDELEAAYAEPHPNPVLSAIEPHLPALIGALIPGNPVLPAAAPIGTTVDAAGIDPQRAAAALAVLRQLFPDLDPVELVRRMITYIRTHPDQAGPIVQMIWTHEPYTG